MKIKQYATPHKSSKKRNPDDVKLAVIHYTGSEGTSGTINWFKDPQSKVSAHYVIDKAGDVYAFEDLQTTLWHAGKSEWQGRKWCNSWSIGYELVGTFESGFTDSQMDSLVTLLRKDIKDTAIDTILGHEHISPVRKVDPGTNFDWNFIRNSNELSPFTNMKNEKVVWIGSYPVESPEPVKGWDNEEMDSGKDGTFAFLSYNKNKITVPYRIGFSKKG